MKDVDKADIKKVAVSIDQGIDISRNTMQTVVGDPPNSQHVASPFRIANWQCGVKELGSHEQTKMGSQTKASEKEKKLNKMLFFWLNIFRDGNIGGGLVMVR
jgi:hypothetical protein